jgi:hypothetical protein
MELKETEEKSYSAKKEKRVITYVGIFSLGVIVGILLSKCPEKEQMVDKEQKTDLTLKEEIQKEEPPQREPLEIHVGTEEKQTSIIFQEIITTQASTEREIEEKYKKEIYEVPVTQVYYERPTCPDIPISADLIVKPEKYWNKKEAVFRVKLKIDVNCYLEGAPIPCTFTAERVKVEFTEDGEKEFKISYGEAPCLKDLINYKFIVDTTPPETKIVPVGFEGVNTTSDTCTFEIIVNEPVKSTLCKIDDGFWMDCSSGKLSLKNIEDGWHKISAFSIDLAGNREDPPKVYEFKVDAKPPITLLLSAPPSITNSRSAEFVFTSDDEDAEFECSINDGEWQKCSSPLILKDLQEGMNKISIRSFDKLGRYEEEPVTYSWRVVSGELKGKPKPYKPPQRYEEILKRQKKHKDKKDVKG